MSALRTLRAFRPVFREAFRTHHAPLGISPLDSHTRGSIACSSYRTVTRATDAPTIRTFSSTRRVLERPLTDRGQDESQDISHADKIAMRKALSPAYQLSFTCKKCLDRSSHTVSKQSYHHGTCVIQCPTCKSQHLISDHLKIFSDTNLTMEDIAKEHGQKLRKGRLGADGDIEFYDEPNPDPI